jgi:glycosyltransferase involved in cell wall biosynthesis
MESLEALAGAGFRWEQIVVDSSPELNRSLLSQVARARPFLHISQAPSGVYPAMNAGLGAAKGEYVWFLNAGDRLSSAENLGFVLEALRDGGAEAGYAAAELWRDGRYLYTQHPRAGILPLLGINRVCHQSLLYRRDLFGKVGAFSEKYKFAADYELHLRALAGGARFEPVDRTIVKYDMGGLSSQYARVIREFAQIQKELGAEGKLKHPALHAAVREFEGLRIGFFKGLGQSAAGPRLRAAWHSLRRLWR